MDADPGGPYALDELAERKHCPHMSAYPSVEEYERGFHLWRALRRDGRLTMAESDAKMRVVVEHMNARHGLDLDWRVLIGQHVSEEI
ncbi:hypothetical protein ABGB18_42605 [Nonomuraea sp. B12E4]|uniref:hypothetical protein n=1 Tax=Nonomuraea sp. B12E4 TaxID=3153564 RepID=UPI00325CEE37